MRYIKKMYSGTYSNLALEITQDDQWNLKNGGRVNIFALLFDLKNALRNEQHFY